MSSQKPSSSLAVPPRIADADPNVDFEVHTTSAQSTTTNTDVQNATIINSSSRTVTYQTTRQTCEHQQRAVVTETITRRAPTEEELAELCKLGETITITSSSPSARSGPKPTPRTFRSYESTETNAGSAWRDKSEPRPTYTAEAVTLSRTEETIVTQSSGRSESTTVEQQNVKRDGTSFSPAPIVLQPGDVYIFNNESGNGYSQNVEALRTTFKGFKMNVAVVTDAQPAKVKAMLDEIEQADYSHHACLLIAILSHGPPDDVVGSADHKFSLNDQIIAPIRRNPTLTGKPKIILVLASKGHMAPDDFRSDGNDILLCYSSFEECGSFRQESESREESLFIQALCTHLKASGMTDDFSDILKKVIGTLEAHAKTKQPPLCIGSISRRFVLGDYC